MLCLARLIRWAIVASGTRNALAISAVVRPPTARSVRAIADGGVSAGWQHMKSRTRVSSRSALMCSSGAGTNGLLVRELGRDRVLAPPAGLLAPDVVGQAAQGDAVEPAAGVVRDAFGGPPGRRRDQRVLHRVLGGGEVLVPPRDGAQHLAA